MAIFSTHDADPRWRRDGAHAFTLLQAYAMAVGGLRTALDPPADAIFLPDPQGMNQAALAAHDEFHAALSQWVRTHAPGSNKDSSKGGFAALSTAMQDAYTAVSLSHLTTMGLTFYLAPVEADGRVAEVAEADSTAIDWYNAAAQIASTILATGEPRGAKFASIYTPRVYTPYKATAAAYTRLQPYINGMPQRIKAANASS